MITRTLKPGSIEDLSGYLHVPDTQKTNVHEIGDFVTLGRDPANLVVFRDSCVSGRHARIERRSNGFAIRDLRSRNGVFVNGSRVFEALLSDGDRIKMGETEISFTSSIDLPSERGLNSRNIDWNTQLLRIPAIAKSELPVLLMGPSGSGKEILAQELHRLSRRNKGTFIGVNCSALSESLVESELFGHIKGSFTGATMDRKGAFETARGGTLFLDEVGDLPIELQPKLLRALENKHIRPVGSDRNIETDVRIIAATHHNLRQKIAEGAFRSDLYFRLHVVSIETPALIDRMEDFETLLYTFARQHRVGFTFAAIERLKTHKWPGNVRELRNVVARAKAYFPDRQVDAADLKDIVEFAKPVESGNDTNRPLLREIENEMIRCRLVANKGNQRRTAADLGIPKSTLHDRIRDYGIDVRHLLEQAGVKLRK